MRKTIESILIFAILIGMLGMLVGLANGILEPIDPDKTDTPAANAPDDGSSVRYTLSGDWIVDTSADFGEDMERVDQVVYYVHKGVSFSDMSLMIDSNGDSEIYGRIVGDSVQDSRDTIYRELTYPYDAKLWNGEENLRRISFGKTEQRVSEEFYEAFTSVAKKAKVQSYVEPDRVIHRISGVWILNPEKLVIPELNTFDERVNIVSDGEKIDLVSFNSYTETINMRVVGSSSESIYVETWKLPEYQIWDFGESEVAVSNAFYRFLVENRVTGVAVEGTWEMKTAAETAEILR